MTWPTNPLLWISVLLIEWAPFVAEEVVRVIKLVLVQALDSLNINSLIADLLKWWILVEVDVIG